MNRLQLLVMMTGYYLQDHTSMDGKPNRLTLNNQGPVDHH